MKNVKEENVTKREIISIGSRIFDPLGIVSPVTKGQVVVPGVASC